MKRLLVAPALNRKESFTLLLATGSELFQQDLLYDFFIPIYRRGTLVWAPALSNTAPAVLSAPQYAHTRKPRQAVVLLLSPGTKKLCWVFVSCSGSESLQPDMTLHTASYEQVKKLALESLLTTNCIMEGSM